MSFIEAFRAQVLPAVHADICPLLLETEFAALVSWHAQLVCGTGTAPPSTSHWDFPKRHEGTKASYVLWVLFNYPTDDPIKLVAAIMALLTKLCHD